MLCFVVKFAQVSTLSGSAPDSIAVILMSILDSLAMSLSKLRVCSPVTTQPMRELKTRHLSGLASSNFMARRYFVKLLSLAILDFLLWVVVLIFLIHLLPFE